MLPGQLSMGDLRRLELARTLATGPEVLLLDEVFAGLTVGEIARISDAAAVQEARRHDLHHREPRSALACAAGRPGGRDVRSVRRSPRGRWRRCSPTRAFRTRTWGRREPPHRRSGEARPALAAPRSEDGKWRSWKSAISRRSTAGRVPCTASRVDVEAGTIVGIIGPNGAGKSTLLDSILGLTDTAGDIRLEGVSLIDKRPADIVRLGIGYAPERGHLFPFMTTRRQSAGRRPHGRGRRAAQPEDGVRPVPRPRAAPAPGNLDAERGRAPDGVARPCPDVEPAPPGCGRTDHRALPPKV